MPEHEGFIPEQGSIEGQERIVDNIWQPGILDKYKDEVGAAASTKMLKRTEEKALRILGDKQRFDKPMTDRIKAGRILAELRNTIKPKVDLHHIIKTQLVNGGGVKKIDEGFVQDLVKGNLPNKQILETDGMITNLKDYPLYISAADCAPVGVYDPKNKAIGAFHNGAWGLLAQISENGIRAMTKEYGSDPQDLIVTIAPSISQDGFEIDDYAMELARKKFGDDIEQFAKPGKTDGKYFFDITGAIVHRLSLLGVKPENIEISSYHTDTDNDLFPSERLEGRIDRDNYGFMIMLK